MNKNVLLLAALAMCWGCGSRSGAKTPAAETPGAGSVAEQSEPGHSVGADRALIAQLRSEALETLTIGAHTFTLEAYLWRDFMPDSPTNGKPMNAINRLVETRGAAIPANIVPERQYVIHGDSVWTADYGADSPPPSEVDKLERVSRNGPKWGPGVTVDVVSRIHDTQTHQIHYLIRKNVPIEQTN